jgi:hypothetical protein
MNRLYRPSRRCDAPAVPVRGRDDFVGGVVEMRRVDSVKLRPSSPVTASNDFRDVRNSMKGSFLICVISFGYAVVVAVVFTGSLPVAQCG